MKELQDHEWKKLIQPGLPREMAKDIVGMATRDSRDSMPTVLKLIVGIILLMGMVYTLWSLRESGGTELFTPFVVLSMLFTTIVLGALYRLRKN